MRWSTCQYARTPPSASPHSAHAPACLRYIVSSIEFDTGRTPAPRLFAESCDRLTLKHSRQRARKPFFPFLTNQPIGRSRWQPLQVLSMSPAYGVEPFLIPIRESNPQHLIDAAPPGTRRACQLLNFFRGVGRWAGPALTRRCPSARRPGGVRGGGRPAEPEPRLSLRCCAAAAPRGLGASSIALAQRGPGRELGMGCGRRPAGYVLSQLLTSVNHRHV